MLKHLLFLSFLSFLIIKANAQYVGTISYSDTASAQGYINFDITATGIDHIEFSAGRSETKTTYTASEIVGFEFYYNDNHEHLYKYQSVNISSTTRKFNVFLLVLYEGNFKILKMERKLSSSYYIFDCNGELTLLEKQHNQFRNVLAQYADSCEFASKYISHTKLNTKSLIKFGQRYDLCRFKSGYSGKSKTSYFISGGFQINHINIADPGYVLEDFSHKTLKSAISPVIGIGIDIPLTKKGTLALTSSLNYYKTVIYDGYDVNNQIKELIFNQHTLEIPASLNIRFSPGKTYMFLSAGPAVQIHLENEIREHIQQFTNNNLSLNNTYFSPYSFKNLCISVNLAGGLAFKVSNHLKSDVSVLYNSTLSEKHDLSSYILGFKLRIYLLHI